MCGEGHGVHIQFREINRDLAQRLYRIGMHPRPRSARVLAQRSNVLDDTRFVIREHHRNHAGRPGQRSSSVSRIDTSIAIRGELAQLPARTHQLRRRFRHARVFKRADDHLRRLQHTRSAFDKGIIRFSPAAGEYHLRGNRTDQRGHLFSRHLDRTPCLRAKLVTARRVTVMLTQKRQHRRQHALVERRGCVMVEIDVAHEHGWLV